MNPTLSDIIALLDKPVNRTLEYRLYYNEDGTPRIYTMVPDEGDYIVITKEQYAEGRYDVVVKDGKLISTSVVHVSKLTPMPNNTLSTKGVAYGTLKDDISIVGTEQYWRMKTYEND